MVEEHQEACNSVSCGEPDYYGAHSPHGLFGVYRRPGEAVGLFLHDRSTTGLTLPTAYLALTAIVRRFVDSASDALGPCG